MRGCLLFLIKTQSIYFSLMPNKSKWYTMLYWSKFTLMYFTLRIARKRFCNVWTKYSLKCLTFPCRKGFQSKREKRRVKYFPLNFFFQNLYNEKAMKKKTALMEDHFISPINQTYWIHPTFHLFPFTDAFWNFGIYPFRFVPHPATIHLPLLPFYVKISPQ